MIRTGTIRGTTVEGVLFSWLPTRSTWPFRVDERARREQVLPRLKPSCRPTLLLVALRCRKAREVTYAARSFPQSELRIYASSLSPSLIRW